MQSIFSISSVQPLPKQTPRTLPRVIKDAEKDQDKRKEEKRRGRSGNRNKIVREDSRQTVKPSLLDGEDKEGKTLKRPLLRHAYAGALKANGKDTGPYHTIQS